MGRRGSRLVLYFAMAAYGMVIAVLSPALPRIGEQFAVPYSALAFIVTLSFLGFSLGIFGGGFLSDRVSPKASLMAGLLLTTAALAALFWARWYAMVVVCFALVRMGFGAMEAGANSQMARTPHGKPAAMMTLMHLFFPIGSTLGALYAGRVMGLGWSWSLTMGACAAATAAACGLVATMKPPAGRVVKAEKDRGRAGELLRGPALWLLAGALTFAVAIEMGSFTWLVTFLQQCREYPVEKATAVLAGFQVGVALGRLSQGWLAERMGYLWFILAALLASALAGGAAVLLPGGAWCFGLMGFTMASLYPVVATAASHIFNRQAGTAMGLVSALNALFNMGLQMLVGKAADLWGLQRAMMALPLFGLLGAAMAGALILIRRSGRCAAPPTEDEPPILAGPEELV